MIFLMGFGLLVLIVFWVLFDSVVKILVIVWEIIMQIYNKKPIDFRKQFGEWAVVTGSTDGIGKAYAKELAARNMNLILISRNLDKLNNTKQEILVTNPNIKVDIIVADFSEGKDAFDKIRLHLQDIAVGILVNNVGKMYEYPMYVGEVPEKDLWDIITLNVGATTLMTRLVLEQMQKRGRGAIVNVSSGSEFQPLPLMTVYGATKAYINNFSAALREEYSRFGITVQHLSPLFVNTKMNAFSPRLQCSNIFVPDATTYAKNAIESLGKIDSSTGYWAHSLQKLFTLLSPVWIRMKIGHLMNQNFRQDYFKLKEHVKVQ